MRRDAKVDQNQQEIIATLRQIGASVYPLHFAGRGCPDLMAGFRGRNYLLEVKTERGTVSAAQAAFHLSWRGHVAVVRTPREALVEIGVL